jgi:hypothetical protein
MNLLVKSGSYPHEFLCRTNCSACADYQPCISNNKFMFVIKNPKGTHLWLFSKIFQKYIQLREMKNLIDLPYINDHWNFLFYCLNIAKSENAMLWRMLSRLETCLVYSCIWSVTLAKSIVPRKTWRKLWHSYISKLFVDLSRLQFTFDESEFIPNYI